MWRELFILVQNAFSMTDNQLTLLTNLINSFHSQIPEKDRIKLARAPHIGRAREFGGEIYNKIKNTISTGLFDHLKTAHLDKVDYWAELILELVYCRDKGIDFNIKECYNYWVNWKVQNTHLLLENKE